jgi:hypothetical protein
VYLSAGNAPPGDQFHSAPASSGAHSEAAKRRFLDRIKVMSLNVKGGTPVYGPSLCETCERALTVKGYRENEKIVVCQAMWPEREVEFPVQECSSYTSKGRESLYEMKKIAWMLQPRGPKRQAGFVAPSHDDDEDDCEIELVLDEEE